MLYLKYNSLLFSLFFTLLKTLLEWGGGDMEGKAQSPGSLTGSSSLLPGQPAQQESCIHLTSFTPWVPRLSLKGQELSWCALTHRYLTDALGRISMEMGSTVYLSLFFPWLAFPFQISLVYFPFLYLSLKGLCRSFLIHKIPSYINSACSSTISYQYIDVPTALPLSLSAAPRLLLLLPTQHLHPQQSFQVPQA